MSLNPFIWSRPIEDGVPRGEFAERTARRLKAGTDIALFGPRGTGKTTFLAELRGELAREHEADAPPWELVVIDLRRAISLPAFIGAVADALANHPSRGVRRRARTAIARLEKEIGLNLGVLKAGVRASSRGELGEAEVLHAQLSALSGIADHLVIAFDEFQRLSSCPGQPLSIIRSALMGPQHTGRLSLLLTGSLRGRLELMLHSDNEPIWDQTLDLDLPDLMSDELVAYLEHRFQATGRPIDEHGVEDLVSLTDAHPKRTQHLAWHVWERRDGPGPIGRDDVQTAFDDLLASDSHTGFHRLIDTLLAGGESEINDARALFLVASGASTGSHKDAHRYGLNSATSTRRAVSRLEQRGLVVRGVQRWRILDPLLAEWLRREDPLGATSAPSQADP